MICSGSQEPFRFYDDSLMGEYIISCENLLVLNLYLNYILYKYVLYFQKTSC